MTATSFFDRWCRLVTAAAFAATGAIKIAVPIGDLHGPLPEGLILLAAHVEVALAAGITFGGPRARSWASLGGALLCAGGATQTLLFPGRDCGCFGGFATSPDLHLFVTALLGSSSVWLWWRSDRSPRYYPVATGS